MIASNTTYARYVAAHHKVMAHTDRTDPQWATTMTTQLLLHMPGVEVAARPWLYPTADYSDSDLRSRLLAADRITERQRPSIKASWMRKVRSRYGMAYESDFHLWCLLYDVALARQISSVVSIADNLQIAPEDAAPDMQNFDVYWVRQQEMLEGI